MQKETYDRVQPRIAQLIMRHTRPLEDFDFGKADPNCKECRGSGKIREEPVFGTGDVVVVVCSCVPLKELQ